MLPHNDFLPLSPFFFFPTFLAHLTLSSYSSTGGTEAKSVTSCAEVSQRLKRLSLMCF